MKAIGFTQSLPITDSQSLENIELSVAQGQDLLKSCSDCS